MNLADEVAREIGNKTREFYEFVLPPIDMHLEGDKLRVVIDAPGFDKDDIDVVLYGSKLSIKARKKPDRDGIIYGQRPDMLDKTIRLPARIRRGEEEIESAVYDQGVLTLMIRVPQRGKSAKID